MVDTHPEDYSVDLVMLDDGSRIVGAQVMSHNGSARAGSVDLPSIGKKKDKWDLAERTDNETTAIVATMRGHPVVLGFIYPQVSEMTFDDPDRRMSRHVSDVYHTIDGKGNVQFGHPAGVYVKIGASPEPDDFSSKNFDKNFAPKRNADTPVAFRYGNKDSYFEMLPNGEVNIVAKVVRVTCDGHTTTISADGVHTPDRVVADTDVLGGGISLKTHQHSGVRGGPDNTGAPVG